MPIVNDPVFGLKPTQELAGGSRTTLPPGSQPLTGYGGRSVALIGGHWRTVSFQKLYRTQPWVAVAARRLSEQMARLPLQVFRFMDAAREAREREREHGAAQLLDNPRPGRKGFHLRWEIAIGLYVDGHYVGWKRRPSPGAPPRELWKLDWRRVTPHRLGDSGPIVAWEWHGDGIPDLKRGQYIFPEDIVSIGFDAPDSEIGVSPLEQLGVTIRIEDAVQRHTEASFANGTRFGALVRLAKGVTADDLLRNGLRDELMEAHSGDNAFRPAILGGGVEDIKALAQTAVEAELIEQRKVDREEVVAVYGLAGPLAGILDKSNSYGSLKEFHRLLYVTQMGGPLGLVDSSLQGQLIEAEPAWQGDGIFCEFSLDAVLKGDAKERWETYKEALASGGLTLNDVRKRENLPPYGDPDDPDNPANQPLIQANNVRPLSAIGAGDVGAGQAVSQSILNLVGKHTARALDRTVRGAASGKTVLGSLDADRMRRELAEDLEQQAGAKGYAGSLAGAVAGELEHALTEAKDADDVRRIANDYALGGAE